jgi:hypothetical protein
MQNSCPSWRVVMILSLSNALCSFTSGPQPALLAHPACTRSPIQATPLYLPNTLTLHVCTHKPPVEYGRHGRHPNAHCADQAISTPSMCSHLRHISCCSRAAAVRMCWTGPRPLLYPCSGGLTLQSASTLLYIFLTAVRDSCKLAIVMTYCKCTAARPCARVFAVWWTAKFFHVQQHSPVVCRCMPTVATGHDQIRSP